MCIRAVEFREQLAMQKWSKGLSVYAQLCDQESHRGSRKKRSRSIFCKGLPHTFARFFGGKLVQVKTAWTISNAILAGLSNWLPTQRLFSLGKIRGIVGKVGSHIKITDVLVQLFSSKEICWQKKNLVESAHLLFKFVTMFKNFHC